MLAQLMGEVVERGREFTQENAPSVPKLRISIWLSTPGFGQRSQLWTARRSECQEASALAGDARQNLMLRVARAP